MLKVSSVPIMYKAESKLCWYAGARMLYKWSQATTRGLALNPADADEGYIWRHSINGTVGSSDNHHFAKKHNLVQHPSTSINESSLLDLFKDHGPIWAGVSKNWNGIQATATSWSFVALLQRVSLSTIRNRLRRAVHFG